MGSILALIFKGAVWICIAAVMAIASSLVGMDTKVHEVVAVIALVIALDKEG